MITQLLTVSILGGLIQLDRKAIIQSLLSQPVIIAPIIGMLLGDLKTGMALGAMTQLLWLGSVSIGASLPSNDTIGTAVITTVACLINYETQEHVWVASLILLAPVSIISQKFDIIIERINCNLLQKIELCSNSKYASQLLRIQLYSLIRITFLGIMQIFIFSFLGYFFVTWVIEITLPELDSTYRNIYK